LLILAYQKRRLQYYLEGSLLFYCPEAVPTKLVEENRDTILNERLAKRKDHKKRNLPKMCRQVSGSGENSMRQSKVLWLMGHEQMNLSLV
jgi:hypothetical protein